MRKEIKKELKKSVILSIRMKPHEYENIKRHAKINKMRVFELIRDALNCFLK